MRGADSSKREENDETCSNRYRKRGLFDFNRLGGGRERTTQTSIPVIRPGSTERRKSGNGTPLPAPVSEAVCASPTWTPRAATASNSRARPQRLLHPRPLVQPPRRESTRWYRGDPNT